MTDEKKFEVWVSNDPLVRLADRWNRPSSAYRFNARFATVERAAEECRWYTDRGFDAHLRVADGASCQAEDT